jgi:hypothetical protein
LAKPSRDMKAGRVLARGAAGERIDDIKTLEPA